VKAISLTPDGDHAAGAGMMGIPERGDHHIISAKRCRTSLSGAARSEEALPPYSPPIGFTARGRRAVETEFQIV
jgi:hypothetical protein